MPYPAPFPAAQRIAVNTVELDVFVAGSGNARTPVVLCHGWPDLAYGWRHQIPALVAAGHPVIVPDQRGFGGSARPAETAAYDIAHLTGDLAGLLDHFGHRQAVFVGHDWGANVVWAMAMLHPERVRGIINLALPYQPRGDRPWVAAIEAMFGPDHYMVQFNRAPGVAEARLDADPERFLSHLLRRDLPAAPPPEGNLIEALMQAETPPGQPLLTPEALAVYVAAFRRSGFAGGINWYRNLDRNWHLLADVDPVIRAPTLMIHGDRDMIPPLENLTDFVPRAEVAHLPCGHWIQQELPDQTNRLILGWLARQWG